eukprot:s43_g49.t1
MSRVTSSSNSSDSSWYCCSLSSFLLFKCITTFVSCATFRISARRSAPASAGPVASTESASGGGVLSSPMARQHGTSCYGWGESCPIQQSPLQAVKRVL